MRLFLSGDELIETGYCQGRPDLAQSICPPRDLLCFAGARVDDSGHPRDLELHHHHRDTILYMGKERLALFCTIPLLF
jgi:hypothetical protein